MFRYREVIMTLCWSILYQEGQYYNFWRQKCSISCAARGAQGIPTLLSKIEQLWPGQGQNGAVKSTSRIFLFIQYSQSSFFNGSFCCISSLPCPCCLGGLPVPLACDDQSEVLGIKVLSLFLSRLNIRAKSF